MNSKGLRYAEPGRASPSARSKTSGERACAEEAMSNTPDNEKQIVLHLCSVEMGPIKCLFLRRFVPRDQVGYEAITPSCITQAYASSSSCTSLEGDRTREDEAVSPPDREVTLCTR